MSLSSLERLLIGLSPSGVALVRLRGALRPRIAAERSLACEHAEGAESWQAALAALRPALADAGPAPPAATVVLSNHFVRYALLPWSKALVTAEEEENYARHHFARIYGERAKTWVLRASPARSGSPRLASAIDAGLLEALHECFPRAGSPRLASVQPYLMAAFNHCRGAIPAAGAWLLLLEPGRACLALHAGNRWRAVRNAKGSFDAPEEWLAFLDRERHRAEGDIPALVLVNSDRAIAQDLQTPGWTLRRLPLADGPYGAALAAA